MKRITRSDSRLVKNESHSNSRRRLLKALALAPAATAMWSAPADLLAQQAKPMPGPAPRSAPGQLNPSPEALALAEIVHERYGKYLTDDQFEEIKLGLERGIRGRQALRRFKFENGDEPCTVFSAE